MLVIFPLPSSHLTALPACLSPSLTTGDISYGLLWLHQLTKTNPNGSGGSQGKSESGGYFYPKRRIHPLINHWDYGVLFTLFFWLVHIHGGAHKHKPAAGVHIKHRWPEEITFMPSALQHNCPCSPLLLTQNLPYLHAFVCVHIRWLYHDNCLGQAGIVQPVSMPLQRSCQCLQEPQLPANNTCQITSGVEWQELRSEQQQPGMCMNMGFGCDVNMSRLVLSQSTRQIQI